VRREHQRHHNGGGEHEKFGIISADSMQVGWWRGRGAPGTATPPLWEAANRRSFFVIISADSIQVEWGRERGAPGTAAPPVWEAANRRSFVI
jgi:hypothetical protein